MKYIILTDANGNRLCGSDGILPISKRKRAKARELALNYRSLYCLYPHKTAYWTHYGIVDSLKYTTINPQPL